MGNLPSDSFFNTRTAYFLKPDSVVKFEPFAQKLTFPPDSEVFYRGDLHGDVHSLLADLKWLNGSSYLHGFKAGRTNFYMVFLGDYTDRGSYGIEVLYTLFRLKLENPDRVFLARGNHEEVSLQARYGLLEEGRGKYGSDFEAAKLLRAYDFLPAVIYTGTAGNFLQCNHGGMEPGYDPRQLLRSNGNPRFQLIGTLQQKEFLLQNPEWLSKIDPSSRDVAKRSFRNFTPDDPISPSVLGFMWNDFSVLITDPQFAVDPGRAFVYGERATRMLLAAGSTPTNTVQAVFRGHQQSSALNPMMRRLIASQGIFRHWQTNDSNLILNRSIPELAKQLETGMERSIPPGSVWTFNVSPDSVYGEGCNYAFDTFGLLKVAPAFSDWRLRVVNISINP
ncbi:MAG TPA: metallophosphoesterase [Verrucomicrobiae bacterium]|nr:metallophosphoesterase [Verrucomicrobiae bacterium]